jgi:hypothetical protein
MKIRVHRRRLDGQLMCDLCYIKHSNYFLQEELASKLTQKCNLGRGGEVRGLGRSKKVKEKIVA